MKNSQHGAGLIMPAVADEVVGGHKISELTIGGRVIKVAQPANPDVLLDLGEVAQAYALDEYMPYWATIWPVCLHMAEIVLKESWRSGTRAIEVGCGLGIPGVAALMAGMDVSFSDYDETALRFAGLNAELNGYPHARLLPMDLRAPIDEQFELILVSDMLYEARFVDVLVRCLKQLLAPGGLALVADQNRAHAERFRAALQADGLSYTMQGFQVEKNNGWQTSAGTLYRVRVEG